MDTPTSSMPQQPMSSPTSPSMSPHSDAPQKSKVLMVVAIVVALIILAFIAFMLRDVLMPEDSSGISAEALAEKRDNASAIEADLKAIDVSNLDTELNDIGTTLNAPKQ